jgi:hypothetical protein
MSVDEIVTALLEEREYWTLTGQRTKQKQFMILCTGIAIGLKMSQDIVQKDSSGECGA